MILKNKIFLSIVGIFILIFLIPFSLLKYGLTIKEIDNKSVNIQSLHLKLDKRLVCNIKELKVYENNESSEISIEPLWIKFGLNIFSLLTQEFSINNIHIKDEDISFLYKDNYFYIGSKLATIQASYFVDQDDIPTNFQFRVPNSDLILYVEAILNEKIVSYKVNTNNISNFEFFKNYMKLDEQTSSWVYDRIKVDKFEVTDLHGSVDTKEISNYSLNDLDIKFYVENFQFDYNQTIPTIDCARIDVSKHNENVQVLFKESKNKSQNISISGELNTDLLLKNISFQGKVYFHGIELFIDTKLKDQIIDFTISSNKFKDIEFLEKFVSNLPNSIKLWGMERLTAKNYKIDSLSGRVFMPHGNLDMDSLKVVATLEDIAMDFNPNKAYPLKADAVQLVYKSGNIDFQLTNPYSNDVNLAGSKAKIYGLFGKSGLLLDLQSVSPINETLVRVVESYGVTTPRELKLSQVNGKSNIVTQIDIPFTDDPTKVYVKIDNNDSLFSIMDENVSFKKFHFLYDKNQVNINDTLFEYNEKSHLQGLLNVMFDLDSQQANVSANIKDLNDIFDIDISNSTSLDKNISSGKIKIKSLKITNDFNITNEIVPYMIFISDEIHTLLPTVMLEHKFDQKQKLHTVDLRSFEKIYELAEKKVKDIPKINGTISLKTKDFNDINITANLNGFDFPIYDKDKKINQIELSISVLDQHLLHINNQRFLDLYIDLENNLSVEGRVQNIGIQLFSSRDESNITKDDSNETFKIEELITPYIDLILNNGYISYDGKTVNYKYINLFSNKKTINIDGKIANGDFYLNRLNKEIFIKYENINDNLLNKFIGSKMLQGNKTNIKIYGDQYYQTGEVVLSDIALKEDNTTNLVINDGNVYFTFDQNSSQLDLSKINIIADKVDIDGNVSMNFEQSVIDGIVYANVLKGYSNIMSKLPVLGYVFLGEDGKVDYKVEISGDLSKPEIETHITKETILVPFYMIGRLLYYPIYTLKKLSNEDD